MRQAYNLNRLSFGQTEARTANMWFAIAGVPCFADTFVQGGGSVLRMKVSAKTPRHRKPPKTLAERLSKRCTTIIPTIKGGHFPLDKLISNSKNYIFATWFTT